LNVGDSINRAAPGFARASWRFRVSAILVCTVLPWIGCTAGSGGDGGAGGIASNGNENNNAPDPSDFSQDITTVLDGLELSEPDFDRAYAGVLKSAEGDDSGSIFMSTCGCGNWQSLIEFATVGESPTGSTQALATLRFPGFPLDFTRFESDPDDPVEVAGGFYGNGDAAFGELREAAQESGRAGSSLLVTRFDALRGDANSVHDGCVRCHLGNDPPRPLPDTHRPVTPETNCLECHETGF